MSSNTALDSAPYSVTICRCGVLNSNSVFGNETAAIAAFKKTIVALGGGFDEPAMEEGYQDVGDVTVYLSANGDIDDIIGDLK